MGLQPDPPTVHSSVWLSEITGVGAYGHEKLLNLNQAKVDQLEIDAIGDEFIWDSEHGFRQFGKFTWTVYPI